MSVRRQSFRGPNGGVREHWIVDFVFRHPDGRCERVRSLSPVPTRRGAEEFERQKDNKSWQVEFPPPALRIL